MPAERPLSGATEEYLAQEETASVGAKHGEVGSGVEVQGKYNLMVESPECLPSRSSVVL